MRKWISLYDLCPMKPGKRNGRTARITAVAYLKNRPDKGDYMERQVLATGEYILLRGKYDGSYTGLLHVVETNSASVITGQALTELYNSVPKTYRKNAVFLMNAVTLNEMSRSLGEQSRELITYEGDGKITLMDKPIVLCNAMPFIREDCIPILFGDFSKVCIEDCGRDEMQLAPFDGNPSDMQYAMTGYMNCTLEDKMAVKGIKIVRSEDFPQSQGKAKENT